MTRLFPTSCTVLLLFLKGFCYGSETEVEVVYGDEGSDLTLPCQRNEDSKSSGSVMWRWSHQGKNNTKVRTNSRNVNVMMQSIWCDLNGNWIVLKVGNDDSLNLIGLSRDEAGVYTCYQEDERVINRVRVKVRTPPPKLANLTVVPSTILALIHWDVEDTGGYPITYFTAQYRLMYSLPDQLPDPWRPILPIKIQPTSTQIDVYQLEPNSTYEFQVWANNRLGRGEITEAIGQTKHDNQEIELAKHLLEGAETFDTRVWVAAVAIVMGTLLVLATATIYALYKECRIPLSSVSEKDVETMELIPNIILNPGFQDLAQTEWDEPDENSNDTTAIRLNNNTVVRPVRI